MVVGIIGLIALQAVLGLVLQREYRDVPWITATWFGNDWITLLAAVPTMTLALVRMRNGSPRWLLVWLGMLAYVAYNYCFYLFGAALNAFFPLYVAAVLLATVLLVRALARIDAVSVVASFSTDTPFAPSAATSRCSALGSPQHGSPCGQRTCSPADQFLSNPRRSKWSPPWTLRSWCRRLPVVACCCGSDIPGDTSLRPSPAFRVPCI
jgi:hypothetical protein